ncbi:MAG: glycosyltransferase [candidate division WOR-3 bacterium]
MKYIKVDKLKILFISAVPFKPDWEGSRKRVAQMVRMFDSFGFEIFFLFVRRSGEDVGQMREVLGARLTEVVDNRPVRFWTPWLMKSRIGKLLHVYSLCNFDVDAWYFPEVGDTALQIAHKEGIDVVIAEYVFFSKALDRIRNTIKIIDTHDVFADRYKVLLQLGLRPRYFSTSQRGEKLALSRADFIIAIQEDDAQHFKKYGHPGVYTIQYAPERASKPIRRIGERLRLCFVGASNDVNYVALSRYLQEIHPALIQSGVDFELVVVGSICDRFMNGRIKSRVLWRGRVDELESDLGSCDVLINSVGAGTGLPIKVLDGLANGLHVVADPGGVRGVPLRERLQAVTICRTNSSWVDAVRVLADRKKAGEDLASVAYADFNAIIGVVKKKQEEFERALVKRLRPMKNFQIVS